ncbi:hypothetical protein [Pedobacter jejuensis]|uniref:Uncharacterized protein n=1 Tax=Pedobacter jejuensis TaxID=1268550 RepID=A0A3N0BND8_9SPHI|nr:hypothetical protein [Pedobacter jejuensis]RNL50226.1 hypothetical protein D7004_18650 [Pedobacter jejuensis]
MKVTLEITDFEEMEKFLSLFRTMKLENIKIISSKEDFEPEIVKGNKSLNPKELFGIWKDTPRNIEDIRAKSWHRNK